MHMTTIEYFGKLYEDSSELDAILCRYNSEENNNSYTYEQMTSDALAIALDMKQHIDGLLKGYNPTQENPNAF